LVPGTPACLLHALDRYGSGRLSRQQVMAPAIRLAEDGFGVDSYVAGTIAFAQRRLRPFGETMRTYFQADGTPLVPASLTHAADRLVQPELARSLRVIAEQGPCALYEGELGERIVADLQANGGHLTRQDFADYRVRELEPLRLEYRGATLVGMPATSGNVTAFQALNILERCWEMVGLSQRPSSRWGGSWEMGKMPRPPIPDPRPPSSAALHLIAEALRRAFRDRFAHLADPELHPVPLEGLLSKEYAAELARGIDPERATPEVQAGDPWRYQMGGEHGRARVSRGAVEPDSTCTTHLTVVDQERNVVALTSTLGETFGSGVVAKGTGIVLNNGMTWFDPEPGQVSSIEAGKRILWAPTPTIVLRDAKPLLAVGAPGARRIMSAVVQSLVNVLDFGLGIQTAVSAPRIHCEGPTTLAEARLPRDVLDDLAARGHRLQVIDETAHSFSFARPNGILIDPATNQLTGGVNQFVQAWAMGW
jgi:gamma-glutamyltranspeptidase/glutathione hydrolase